MLLSIRLAGMININNERLIDFRACAAATTG